MKTLSDLLLQGIAEVLNLTPREITLHFSFVENGGSSISAVAFVSHCRSLGVSTSVKQILSSSSLDELFCLLQPEVMVEDIKCLAASIPNDIQYEKPPVCAMQDMDGIECSPKSQMVALDVFETGSLTEMQLALIHGSLKNPGTNIIYHCETYFSEFIPQMKQAWKGVIESEPIFQSSLIKSMLGNTQPHFHWVEVTVDNEADYQRELQTANTGVAMCSFHVIHWSQPAGGQPQSTIVWAVHHALIDGYSSSIVLQKVRQTAAGLSVSPGPSFENIIQEILLLSERQKDEGKQFWKTQAHHLEHSKGELLIPASKDIGDSSSTVQSAEFCVLSGIMADDQSSIGRRFGVTPACVYFAAWALVLSIYADSDEVVFGIVLSGRNLPIAGVEGAVGSLVNTLPLCVSVDRRLSTLAFLQKIFAKTLDLADFQWTTPENGFTRDFASALAMQIALPVDCTGVLPIQPTSTKQSTDIPLSISIEPDGEIRFVYHKSRYLREDVERMGKYYTQALKALVLTHDDATIGSCLQSLMEAPELETLMTFGNCISNQTTSLPVNDDLVTLFESTVQKAPSIIALRKGDCAMSYANLDMLSSSLAAGLNGKICEGEVVCVHADRSLNWIVAIFGILKAGGVYCPVDCALPPETRDMIVCSSGAKLFLVPDMATAPPRIHSCDRMIGVEELLSVQNTSFPHRLAARPSSNAYLCFTSGSTGKPKGVMCSHEGLVAFQKDLEVRLFAQPGRRISQLMSVAFDGSIHEIFSALSYGATLVMQNETDLFLHLKEVDSAILTPSLARVLNPQDYEQLDTVYLVGEPVPQPVADSWAASKKLYNMYGPTEGTCGATIKRLYPGIPVTLGRPNPSTRVYIMSRKQSLVPPGVIGEIYLAGVQVARGYINLPEETDSRFLADPVCFKGERMYRTGDRGYWTPQGEIVCLGRTDRQIKLRGFRLDLDDLEIRLRLANPDITAVALARHNDHMIAAIMPGSANVPSFISRARKLLPTYARPSRVFAVDIFPVTRAGKLDYKAIVQLGTQMQKSKSRKFKTHTEEVVADCFRAILKLGPEVQLDTQSDFHDLGGHSVLQIHLINHLRRRLGRRLPLRLAVENVQVETLARSIDEINDCEPLSSGCSTLGESALSPMEMEWWQKYKIDQCSSAFNVSFVAGYNKALTNRRCLVHACNEVLARHQILRSRYVYSNSMGGPVRQYAMVPPRVQQVKKADSWVEINRPFSLSQNAPVRLIVSETQIILVMSHIVADLTTLQIVLGEIATAYEAGFLPDISRTYMDSTLWSGKASLTDLNFWSEYLADRPPTNHLIGHKGDRTRFHGSSAFCEISKTTYAAMQIFLSRSTITGQQLTLAAVALCLEPPSAENAGSDIILGIPYMNRPGQEDLHTVGLFLEPMAIRIRYSPCASGTRLSYLQTVQQSIQSALGHVVPWNQLLDHLKVKSHLPNHPLFDAVVTYHSDSHSHGLRLAVPGVESCYTFAQGAKFRLLCEFSAVSEDKLILRIEYDTDCFTPQAIRRLQELISRVLLMLVNDVTYEGIRQTLADPAELDSLKTLHPDEVFGAKWAEI